MVEASDHGYVLHTRRIHVTQYRIRYDMISDLLEWKYAINFRTSIYVQQRKTYTMKAAHVHLNCYSVITVT
jgi:hypothetical protein